MYIFSNHRQPDLVAPFVLAVCHPDGPDASGKAFEVGAGFVAEIRWERSEGAVFKPDSSFTPSAVSLALAVDERRRNIHLNYRSKPNGRRSPTSANHISELAASLECDSR